MRIIRSVHRWLGLSLALPLLVQGLTGTVLTLEPSAMSLGRQPAVEVGSPNALIAAALAAGPAGMRAARYLPPPGAGEPARIYLLQADRPRGPSLVVAVDPATARALGPAVPASGLMEWIKRLHENWLLPELGGRQFAGWLGVGLVLVVILGVPLWWPRAGAWADGFTVPRRARGARLQRRLHGALGAWCMAMLLATGVTGITQGFPRTTRAVLGLASGPGPAGPQGSRTPRAATAEPPDLDAALVLARSVAPGTVLRFAILPPGGEPLRLILGPPGVEGARSATTITVDRSGKRVIDAQSPEAASGAEAALRVARDLHVGEGFGPVWRGLTAVTGLALPAFGGTGVLLWWLKRRNRGRIRRQGMATAGSAAEAS